MRLSAPRVFQVDQTAEGLQALSEAVALIKEGKLVAFPTETVYGLGADATNPEAIERLNRVKGRPPEKPYSLHLASMDQVSEIVQDLSPLATVLMKRFWPGPLTIIVSYGKNQTVGLRVPDHPVAQAFLTACAVPVAAPSANRSGQPPPQTAQKVIEYFQEDIDGCIDGGPTTIGRSSTVVAVEEDRVIIHREGAVGMKALQDMVGSSVVHIRTSAKERHSGR